MADFRKSKSITKVREVGHSITCKAMGIINGEFVYEKDRNRLPVEYWHLHVSKAGDTVSSLEPKKFLDEYKKQKNGKERNLASYGVALFKSLPADVDVVLLDENDWQTFKSGKLKASDLV